MELLLTLSVTFVITYSTCVLARYHFISISFEEFLTKDADYLFCLDH